MPVNNEVQVMNHSCPRNLRITQPTGHLSCSSGYKGRISVDLRVFSLGAQLDCAITLRIRLHLFGSLNTICSSDGFSELGPPTHRTSCPWRKVRMRCRRDCDLLFSNLQNPVPFIRLDPAPRRSILSVICYPLSYGVPVRERYGSTLLPATREQHDQNCTQSH